MVADLPRRLLKAIRVDIGLGYDFLHPRWLAQWGGPLHPCRRPHRARVGGGPAHGQATTFETWLREVLSRTPCYGPLVLPSTVHRIKGAEAGHYAIFDASQGLFPHRLANDEEGELCLFHVALTWACSQIVALADAEAPSIFLADF